MSNIKRSKLMNMWAIFFRADPRYYQSAVLAGLLTYGLVYLSFDVRLSAVVVILATALISQWAATTLWKLPHFDPKSAFISGLSLCLLLRTNDLALYGLAASLAVFSKFVLRWRGKHVFNPSNFALALMSMACDGSVWVSPGQWGHGALLGFLTACLGGFIVNRAARSDVTWAFLSFYAAIVFGRALWLGDPLSIPLHMVSNGGLILFAFYMISDPKTTPYGRMGRIIFALLVACLAAFIQFGLYKPRGLFYSLFLVSLLTPFLDHLFPKEKHRVAVSRQAQPGEAARAELSLGGVTQPVPLLRNFILHRRF